LWVVSHGRDGRRDHAGAGAGRGQYGPAGCRRRRQLRRIRPATAEPTASALAGRGASSTSTTSSPVGRASCSRGHRCRTARRTGVRGGSAGGYTTLAAAQPSANLFTAGRQPLRLQRPRVMAREDAQVRVALSRFADRTHGRSPPTSYRGALADPTFPGQSSAIILMQGAGRPRASAASQPRTMYRAVRAKGLAQRVPAVNEGEQHGFSRAATIRRAFRGRLYFLRRVFGFAPAGARSSEAIDNIPDDAAKRRE